MDRNRLYVDFHVLQTVPPSCVNRDDTGSPKTAVYGGTTRARVSSQAWKHAMREMFREELLDTRLVGERTKKVLQLLEREIEAMAPEKDAESLAKKVLEYVGLKLEKKDKKETGNVDTLFFLSHDQIKGLAQLAVEDCKDKKMYQSTLREMPSVDMALFGRMVAADPSLNYDAAAQVAHSISTHKVQNEYDYFTAVDDCAPENSAGAGHLGTVEYNSSTLYRYATVNVLELTAHIGKKEAVNAVRVFAEAFIRAMPTGKQNTFANRTLPDAVYITIRNDQPVNLCGAFEKAVAAGAEGGYVVPSKKRLLIYAQEVYEAYTGTPAQSFAIGSGMEALAPVMPLGELLTALEDNITEYLSGKEVE
ncbi:MAG: type I-E CRISPR-associated protein Cas7/Cse4/CasC [Butyricicoccus pullicaecorum]|nr:type I-E CRISPR-associated protein Cas7/Cse4/CasC [Butyricicoccus pullicaecorum]